MFKKFVLLAVFFSQFLSAQDSIVGKWKGKSNSTKHVYSIELSQMGADIFLSYVFIYDRGRKINDHTSEKVLLKKTSSQCWSGKVSDFFNDEKTMVTLCKKNELLVWETELSILYLPEFENFIRE